jgi:hypothetical protein
MDPNKYFRGETPPALSFTFAEAVAATDVVVRFAPRFSTDSVLDLTVTMSDTTHGTASPTADDLESLTADGVYDYYVLGDGMVLDDGLFLIRTLPTPAEVS